ncbi:MAG: hypothetical protein K6T87_16020 [Roseiflexus sp.]|uniref:hypothetical protein n=1 Tax=Roseiflexus sp. TaxID=2562120 RepID=UPI0025FF0ECE|nr:hypothetical protein [Roseiflexus sp.]MCL6542063.1 hypothetical protein [Roseiflexus sp.]
MIQICSVCKEIYGEKEPYEDRSYTHGYCPVCFEKEMNKLKKQMLEMRIQGKNKNPHTIKDEWYGILKGWAYEGVTYEGAPIFFVGTNLKDLSNFMKEFVKAQEIEDPEETAMVMSNLFIAYPSVRVIYPYERIGKIESELPDGTIIFEVDEFKYIKVAPSRMRRIPGGYVYY